MLYLLLEGHERARARSELASVIDKHNVRLQGRRFLQVPYRRIGADSLKEGVLGGYLDHVSKLHPEAPLPAAFAGDQILADAKEMRGRLGDQAFFDAMGGGGEDDGFGTFETGLGAISQHTKSLGYDGVILFIDELIMWLTTHVANVEFVTTEASKLATLVESSKGDRPVPIISFIARQRDMTEFVGVGLLAHGK